MQCPASLCLIHLIIRMSFEAEVSRASHDRHAHIQVYGTICLAMAMPVLLWPAIWLQQGGLNAGVDFSLLWMVAASTLLISAITADSVLFYRNNSLSVVLVSAWVVGGSFWILLAVQQRHGAWLIALAFALHALRSAMYLWRGEQQWWLWPAWWRDTILAAGMFVWLTVLMHV